MTAQQMIERGLRLLGVVDSGTTPSTDELNDGLEVLNSMLAFWGSQSWCAPYHAQDSKLLTVGDGDYNIGTAQEINTTLPIKIVSAWLRDSSGYDVPLDIISQEEYAEIFNKAQQGQPEKLVFIRSGGTTGVIKLWPVPDTADTLYIESQKPLGNYALTDPLGLPSEYERPIGFNFAIDYGLEFGVEATPTLVAKAEESLAGLKASNAHPVPSVRTDLAGLSKPSIYNPYTDDY